MRISEMIRQASKEVSAKAHMRGPAALDKYYNVCMDRYDNKEYCARTAWNIFCSYVNPDHPGCTEFGKTWGPPYSEPLSKK